VKVLRKIFLGLMVFMTLVIVYPIGANAEWKQSNTGWWYTEGNSWAIGWKQIDGQWYYFDANGYMKTGWAYINGAYYFFYSNGVMASNATIGGFTLGADGRWMPTSQVRLEGKLAEQEAINKFTSQPVEIVEDNDKTNNDSDKKDKDRYEDEDIDGITHVDRDYLKK